MAWLLDLDGVVWLAHQEIPGVAAAVARLRAAGERVLFLHTGGLPSLFAYGDIVLGDKPVP